MGPDGIRLDRENLTSSFLLGCERLKKAQYRHLPSFRLEEKIFEIAAQS
jgi:hypothetical protein